jgi:hypothetical protein
MPLLAQSGHSGHSQQCPLSGAKRTLVLVLGMSAFDPRRTWGAVGVTTIRAYLAIQKRRGAGFLETAPAVIVIVMITSPT